MIDFIRLKIEPNYLTFQPGSKDALSFKAFVTNYSQDFYSFYLELIVPGIDTNSKMKWYSTEPQVATKKPPGATTEFTVNLHRSPRPGYEHLLDLTVRAIAIENPELFVTETLTLKLEAPLKPLTLSIHNPRDGFQGYPGDLIEIPVTVSNLSQEVMAVKLIFQEKEELDKNWIIDGTEKEIKELNPGEPQFVTFACQPPETGKALSQAYNFKIIAQASPVIEPEPEVSGKIDILSKGVINWECDETEKKISGINLKNSINFTIKLTNFTNLTQDIAFDIFEKTQKPHHLAQLSTQGEEEELAVKFDSQQSLCIYTGFNFNTIEPEKLTSQTFKISQVRSWLGMGSQLKFQLRPYRFYQNIKLKNNTIFLKPEEQTITLDVKPIIPFWLQLLILMIMLLLTGLWWLLLPKNHHRDPVNSVAFDGKANTVISGSSDRSIRYWQVEGNQLDPPQLITEENEKAVRVVRFLPKDNEQIAAGLETGEINLWNVTNKQSQGSLYVDENRNDRVFALEFTKDSRYLLSAHGSGIVRIWDLAAIGAGIDSADTQKTEKSKQESGLKPIAETYDLYKNNFRIGRELIFKQPFALLTLGISERRNQPRLVFFAGQYNKVAIWENWEAWQEWQLLDEDYYYNNYYDFTSYESFQKQQKRQFKTRNKLYYLNYRWQDKPDKFINQYNYITSIDTHEEIKNNGLPNLLASADTAGYITLWNLDRIRQCIQQSPGIGEILNCSGALLEQWNNGHQYQPVRTVALSQNGCYLASTGDNGRVMLWSLNPDGTRVNETGKIVAQFPGLRLNSMDIKTFSDEVRLTFDGKNHSVQIKKIKIKNMKDCMEQRETR